MIAPSDIENAKADQEHLQVILLGGGLASSKQVKGWVKDAQREQHELYQASFAEHQGKKKAGAKVAVNRLFLSRLLKILKM